MWLEMWKLLKILDRLMFYRLLTQDDNYVNKINEISDRSMTNKMIQYEI